MPVAEGLVLRKAAAAKRDPRPAGQTVTASLHVVQLDILSLHADGAVVDDRDLRRHVSMLAREE
jgi:hypothetical protein